MKPRLNILTLAVEDLDKSQAFYRDGLGLTTDGVLEGTNYVTFELQTGLALVLYPRAELIKLTGQSSIVKGSTEFCLTHAAIDRAAVDTILERAVAAGATLVAAAQEHEWGYLGNITDLDGHLWEIIYNPSFGITE
jgi:predicted lactoylglutathione lyase